MLSLITNIASQVASAALAQNQLAENLSIQQLSSGKRIVQASIDPAGLAVALEMSGLLGGLNQASINAQNANGMLQTADGALANVGNALTTMQQLANEAADGTINDTQRQALDSQFQALFNQINNIANSTQFNGNKLLQGGTVVFQVGATNSANDQLTVTLPTITAGNLLGVSLPASGTQLASSGASKNVAITVPSINNTVTLGAAAASSGGAANGVAAAATNGQLSANAPAWVQIQVVQGGSLGSAGGIKVVVKDSAGNSSAPVTVAGANLALTNVDGLGFDLALGSSGDTYNAGDTITLAFGTPGGYATIANQTAAQSVIAQTNTALATLASYRGQIGASEQQLSTISSNLSSETQNLSAALSSIQDANIAQTYAAFTQQVVLSQASVAVLKQANSIPQQLATLFQ
jgi:flagellin